MTVFGAAFANDRAARAAQTELQERLALDPASLSRAPLGAVGERSTGRSILAGRVPGRDVSEATLIIERHGGEIVTEISTPGATGVIRVEAGASTRH